MLVRPVLAEELDALGELLAGTYVQEGWASASYAGVLRDTAGWAAQTTVLVAVDDDGALLGGVAIATRGGRYAEQAGPGEAVMRALVTSASARGRGVGEALVRAAVQVAESDGCSVVRLSTQPGMQAAHRLYERLGFTRTPDRDWEPEPGLLLWTYERVLVWCTGCGEPGTHAHDPLDPPRWCSRCRRRMVVQVTPTGWTARCVEHGTVSG